MDVNIAVASSDGVTINEHFGRAALFLVYRLHDQGWKLLESRVFVFNSPILLMDEPFGALDAMTRVRLQDLLLAAAELIGANSGIGWYVKNFADFADYQRVIVGILFIGIVVTFITRGTERLERYLLRWRS